MSETEDIESDDDNFKCIGYWYINEVLEYCTTTLTDEIELSIITSLKEKIETLDVGKISDTNCVIDQCNKYYAYLFKEIDKDQRLRHIFLRVTPVVIDKFVDDVEKRLRRDDVNNVCWILDILLYCEADSPSIN
jgi:hypothetical protein